VPPEIPASPTHDPYSSLRYRDFRLYLSGRIVAVLGGAMTSVAIGWEMYERTHSATALGLVGLTQALPVIFLALPAGHVADRYNRKRVTLITLAITTLCTLGLAFVSHFHDKIPDSGVLDWGNSLLRWTAALFGEPNAVFTEPAIPLMFALLLGTGIAMTFFGPARQAMLPNIVPLSVFSNAVTWGSSAFQLSSVFGPMLGGFLIATTGHYAVAYLMDGISTTICFFTIAPMRYKHQDHTGGERITLKTLGAGIKYVRDTKIILATITLDLFAVFLGGAVALLPMFAKDILNVGAMGLG